MKRFLIFSFTTDRPKGGFFDCSTSVDDYDTAILEARNRLTKGKTVQVFDSEIREIVFDRAG